MKRIVLPVIVLGVAIWIVWAIIQYYAPPPTLSKKRRKAYEQIITFSAQHKDWEFTYLQDLDFRISNYNMPVSDSKRRDVMRKFDNWLEGTSTIRVYRRHDLIFFTLEPQFPLMWTTPGYIYSPYGVDPRKEYDFLLNISRPFYPLKNNWYYSKNLKLGLR